MKSPSPITHYPCHELLCCPDCKGNLVLKLNRKPHQLYYCNECNQEYPVINEVPRFVLDPGIMDNVAESFGFQWTAQSTGEFEADTIYGESEEEELDMFLERFGLPLHPREDSLKSLSVLDAGCGSGRLTSSLGKCGAQCVIGCDISASVEVASRRSRNLKNVQIIQGNIFELPLKRHSFDLVWSEGVIHHTPDAHRAFRSLCKLVKPGGKLYIWLYPPTFNPYRLLRDMMPFAWKLPHGYQLFLCRLIAIPLWIIASLLALFRITKPRGYKQIVFAIHDNISPQYQSRHTNEELMGWFQDACFVDIHPTGPITGVVGTAPKDSHTHQT